ncbi:MAG: rhodanese-like domain-containing protein [Myxococcota bacterium]
MRDWLVVDIRTAEERQLLGWIPGSRRLAPERVAGTDGGVLVVCQSGRRSAEVVAAVGQLRVVDLVGGTRGWEQAGLPLCRRGSAPPGMRSIGAAALVRELRSWFVVEAIESRGATAIDPVGLFDALYPPWSTPKSRREFEARLDRLAELAWWSGHRLDAIAAATTRFLGLASIASY